MGTKAAIFLQRGALNSKQEQACLDHIVAEHWSMECLVPYWAAAEAVALVRAGVVEVVVTAFDSRAAQSLAAAVGAAGTVMFMRPEPTVIEPPRRSPASLVELILRWWRKGRSAEEIAADIEGDTAEVKAIIRRAGEEPDRSD